MGRGSEIGPQLLVQRLLLTRPVLIGCDLGFDSWKNRVGIYHVVEIASIEETVLSNERDRFDGKPALLETDGFAAKATPKSIGDRVDLQRPARQRDFRAGMPNHVVRLQHAEGRENPAEIQVALIKRRRDR